MADDETMQSCADECRPCAESCQQMARNERLILVDGGMVQAGAAGVGLTLCPNGVESEERLHGEDAARRGRLLLLNW